MRTVGIKDAFDSVWRNLRHAVRGLARAPGLTLTVVVTLAVAIGANTTVFSVIDVVLLRPLPFPDAERLVSLGHVEQGSSLQAAIPPVRLLDWNDRSSTFEAIAVHYNAAVTDTSGDRPELVIRAAMTPGFLDLWGIAPAIGRTFTDEEHRFGGPSAVLLSDRYWRERLNADPDVIGNTLQVNDQSPAIVGVMPPEFAAVDRSVDLWVPHTVDAPWTVSREGGWFGRVVGRLEAGVSIEQARTELETVQAQLAAEHPQTDAALAPTAAPYKDTVVGAFGASLWLLFGAVSALLLIACTNVAAVLLARGAQRERGVSIRYSLGASRAAITWHLLTEAIVLVAAGTVGGILLASAGVAAMTSLITDLPRIDEVILDDRVLLYTIASAVAVTLGCGLLPASRSARDASPSPAWSRTQVSPQHSLSWLLVGVQVALSVALLAGAGLLLRSFDALSRVDPGFDPTRVLAFQLSGNREIVDDAAVQRIDRTLEALTALPGIEAAATTFSFLPGLSGLQPEQLEFVEGRVAAEPRVIADTLTVSPSYFETMGIALVSGELCRQPGNRSTQAVVNRSFADRYFPDRSVIGLRLAGDSPDRIVGIVANARERGMHMEAAPTVYTCFSAPTTLPLFLVRTQGEPLNAIETVRAKLGELEPRRAVYDIAPLTERIGDAYTLNRLRTALLMFFSVTALSLACLGIYGTLSYIVTLRRREIGLRVALGAQRTSIVLRLVGRALRVTALACLAGLALSFAFTTSLSSMLYGIAPTDPITYVSVIGVVLLVSAAAALLPARRASRVDPMQSLRED